MSCPLTFDGACRSSGFDCCNPPLTDYTNNRVMSYSFILDEDYRRLLLSYSLNRPAHRRMIDF
jgi:hypothetical protein